MLYVFAGGHRMGSHFQTFVVSHALAQTRRRFERVDPAAMNTFHLGAIRRALAACDAQADKYFIAKAHAAFPIQIDALLTAQTARVFSIWRPQRDCLVSDYHFAKANAGHRYANFDDYFVRRGRRVLLRNRLQEVAWSKRGDPRVRSWQYLDLRNDFARIAGEMLTFARIDGVDLGQLADGLQIDKLRDKYRDPQGRFFRKGGSDELADLSPSPATMEEITKIETATDVGALGRDYLACDRWKACLFGSEAEEAGWRKGLQTWLYRSPHLRKLQRQALPRMRRLSFRRLTQDATSE